MWIRWKWTWKRGPLIFHL